MIKKEINSNDEESIEILKEGETLKKIDYNGKKSTRKNKERLIRIMLVLVMLIFLGNGAFNKTYAKEQDDKSINLFKENSIKGLKDTNKSDKQDNDIKEKTDNNMLGTNEEGKNYSYDAVEVERKLKNYEYSNNGKKMIFLTFDDGASTTVTPKILEILDKYNVKATFFAMGKTIEDGGEAAKELIRKEFDNGHAIGNHSYCHDYSILFPHRSLNLEAFKADYEKNNTILKEILGNNFSTRVIRCPGGEMSWKNMSSLDTYLSENNMASIDWNALDSDADGKKRTAKELVDCAIKSAQGKEMVIMLMHDTYGKEETAKALPQIIEYFKQQGYEFRTLA